VSDGASGDERERFRRELVAGIPGWYSPWAHLAFPSLVGLGIIVGAGLGLRDLRAWQLATVPLMFLAMNAGEWRVHRDLLHRRTPPLQVLYDRHTPEHHRVFVSDDMAIRSTREFRLVLIPFYGILAALVASAPLPLALWALGQRNVALLTLATIMGYTVLYEWLHLSYHLPPDGAIGRLVAPLRRHHAVHHSPELMQKWNFNVSLPLWDRVRGTIYRG
jgi:sterol desaturase/sphingolipid hydroxylase (fatty acid hydroxylase superfamily)